MRYIDAADVVAAACELLGDDASARIDADAVTGALAAAERTASDALHRVAARTFIELARSNAAAAATPKLAALGTLLLLEANGCELRAPQSAAAKVLRAAADGDIDEQELTRWFDEHVAPAGEEDPMFERFTDRARRALALAQEEAVSRNHDFIGTEHLLLALMAEGEGVAARALAELNLDADQLGARIESIVGRTATGIVTGTPPFTPRTKRALELALREALDLGHNYIGTEHLLLGIVREGEGVAAHVLEASGASLADVREVVLRLLTGQGGADASLLRTYLDDVAQQPALSDEEEDDLARRIQAGRDATARLTAAGDADRAALEDAIAAGQAATNSLVGAHLRTVVRIAQQYRKAGQNLLDLIQEGNLGLLQAAQSYGPGQSFEARATDFIRKAIGGRVVDGDVTCTFCGKGKTSVKKLIAGPGVYICDECIGLCNDIIAEEIALAPEPAVDPRCPCCRTAITGGLRRVDVTVADDEQPRSALTCPACGAVLGFG